MVEINGYGIAVIVFLVLSLTVGGLTYKLVQKSGRRLIVAGKSLPLFMVGTMLVAQAVDGNSTLGAITLIYQFGFWAGVVIPIGLGICLLLTGLIFGKKLNTMALFTLPDYYYRRYGNGSEAISGILMIISFVILVAGNFAASGFILETVLGIPFLWGIIIASLVVITYTIAGGLFASAYTDIFQIYLAIGSFWAAFIFFAGGFSGVSFDTILASAPPAYLDLSGLYDIGNGALVNWGGILALGLGDLVALDFMERVFAARDPKTARRGAFMGAGLTIFTVLPVGMLGIVAFHFLPGLEDPYKALPLLAMNHMPFVIGASILMGVLGASMSTANGGLLAVSAVISRNLLQRVIRKRLLGKESWKDSQLLMITRLSIVPVMISALILGYLIPQPGVYLILAFDIVFAGALAPLTLGLFWKKANMPAAITSLVVGTFLRLLLYFIIPPELAGLDTMIPPPISFALFIIVALATQKKWPGKERHDVNDYVPPEEDLIAGEDLKHFKSTTNDSKHSAV
jgi:solute:Na+ symporter, SSS family